MANLACLEGDYPNYLVGWKYPRADIDCILSTVGTYLLQVRHPPRELNWSRHLQPIPHQCRDLCSWHCTPTWPKLCFQQQTQDSIGFHKDRTLEVFLLPRPLWEKCSWFAMFWETRGHIRSSPLLVPSAAEQNTRQRFPHSGTASFPLTWHQSLSWSECLAFKCHHLAESKSGRFQCIPLSAP